MKLDKPMRDGMIRFFIRLAAVSLLATIAHDLLLHRLPFLRGSGHMVGGALHFAIMLLFSAPIVLVHIRHMRESREKEREAYERLKGSETLYKRLVETMSDAVLIHADGVVVYANPATFRMVGADREEQLLGCPVLDFVPDSFAESIRERMHRLYRGETLPATELQYVRLDGSCQDMHLADTPIEWKGRPAGIAVVRNVTDRNRTRQAYERIQSQLSNLIDNVDVGLWSVDQVENRVLFASSAVERLYGTPVEQLVAQRGKWLEFIHPDDVDRVLAVQPELEKGRTVRHQYRLVAGDTGDIRHVEDRTIPVLDECGRVTRLDGVIIDITDRVEFERKLERAAYRDELTGLWNRRAFHDRLQDEIREAERLGRKLAVVYMDLDKFKKINDSLGHYAGDRFLREATDRLTVALGDKDVAARMGGDEFTAVLREAEDRGAIVETLERMRRLFREPYKLDGYDFYVGVSMGVSIYPDDSEDGTNLLNYADSALLFAKKTRGGYRFFEKTMSLSAVEGVILETDLRKALEQGEFELHYQPQYEVRGAGKLVGAEALIRWNHPQLGQIPPAKFIPLAEETGLIEPIGEWVIREVCLRLNEWKAKGWALPIAANLSVSQFRSGTLVDRIRGILDETGADPGLLELEITESMAMDAGQAYTVLHELSRLGVQISIDDFGTGYSSMAYLNKFPIHRLKIDRSFIDGIDRNGDNAAIVSAIATLGHHLNMNIVAEGVETREQVELLNRIGCDVAQGYYFSKPLPLDRFEALAGKAAWDK
ncbi:putative bifunctional diguanylate cyclase/phosphodiesterase [Paenibacillus flagellatus]|uniref:Diguanylate cyclase n=1 Tax=Paenibacillus flagellatus TaxID=2211139 RepID=A0A2V5JXP3_9BACL|nr:EAL domain-containing protein [Paenibacillus flagellatus]PYI51052.1 hypothetical protein DLM86_27190 [Paenibacillus flagellatus]